MKIRPFLFVSISKIFIFRYTFVAGGEGDKGLVGAVKEKAAEAYVYLINN